MAVVTFLSDYGLDDDFVGVCHGVIARIAPAVRVIDITHGIARHDVRSGALVLRRALEYMPAGVHLAVVDPGVGTRRRAVALRCEGDGKPRLLVGPDNGLLWLAAERLGGVREAADIGSSPLRLEPISAASATPPKRSAASHSNPLSGPTSRRSSPAQRSATARRDEPTPGSTTARCTPAGMYASARRRTCAPARTSWRSMPCVTSMTRTAGAICAITPWQTPTKSSSSP